MTRTAERTTEKEGTGRKPIDRHVLVLPIPETIEMGSCANVFSRVKQSESCESCPTPTNPVDPPPPPPGPPPTRP